MLAQPHVSVIVPTHNRAASLERTLKSLAQLAYPRERLEVVIVDDGSTDDTAGCVRRAEPLFAPGALKYAFVPKGNITQAKNRGLEVAAGEIVAFTDDDCTFEPEWLTNLVAALGDPEVAAAGGDDRAPRGSPPLAAAVDYGFTSLLGSGGVRRGGSSRRVARFLPRGCNMAVRRAALKEVGTFDTRMYNGEEIDLDYRLLRAGFRVAHAPSCPVWHHRRSTWRGLARQVFHRGVTRRMLMLKFPERAEAGYLAPAALVLYFAVLAAASLAAPALRPVLLLSALAYAALLAAGAAHAWRTTRRGAVAALVPGVIAVQHFVYGAGLLAAPLRRPFVSLRRDLRRAAGPKSPLRVLISNDGYGTNQGDRAILAVMQSDLRERFPGAEIRGFLNSWVPGPSALWRFWRDMRWADVFLLGGGQVLHDQTCLLFLLAALYKLALARLAGTPSVLYAVGAGPLQYALGRRLVRRAVGGADLVIVRDEASRALLGEIGVRGPAIEVSADPAWRLAPAPRRRAEEILRDVGIPLDGRPLVAICPRRWFHYRRAILPMRWRRRLGAAVPGVERFAELAAAFARLADWLARDAGAAVVLLPMKNAQGRGEPGQDDDAVCWEIAQRAERTTPLHTLSREIDPSEVKAVLGVMSCVVAMRMHAVIMAAEQGVPCVGVGLSEKFDDVFARLGMERFLVAAESADEDGLFGLVREALAAAGSREERAARAAPLVERSRRSVELLDAWLRARYAGVITMEEAPRGG